MKAMILAAGFGKRMRPLTEKTPKPLLEVNGTPLIEKVIVSLRNAGVREIIINYAWLGQQIVDYCGDGSRFGVAVTYSAEDQPLETAGGIARALPLLGDEPFIVVNGDVYTDYNFAALSGRSLGKAFGHLVLVANPVHHQSGDFAIENDLLIQADGQEQSYTFSGISLLSPQLFDEYQFYHGALAPLFHQAIVDKKLTAEVYRGEWVDVGTPERLAALQDNAG